MNTIQVKDPASGQVYEVPAPGANGGGTGPANSSPMSNSYQLFSNTIPTPEDFDKLLIPDPTNINIIWHEYYDSVVLNSAAAQQPTLFNQPASPLYRSNLVGANGRLQGNDRFLVESIRFEIVNDTATLLDATKVKDIFRLTTYELICQDGRYNSGLLSRFLNPVAPILLNTLYYATNPFMSWRLPLPIPIGTNTAFMVNLNMTLNPTLSGNWYLYCYLGGALYKSVH